MSKPANFNDPHDLTQGVCNVQWLLTIFFTFYFKFLLKIDLHYNMDSDSDSELSDNISGYTESSNETGLVTTPRE